MVFQMNAMFLKFFKEVLLGLPITEPNMKRGMRGLEEEDPKPREFRARVDLRLGAIRSLSERERDITTRKREKERISMHEICMNM